MRKSKKIIVFALFLIVAFTLFAQNAQVKFQDETSTTAGYLNLEYPGGSYPAGAGPADQRWKMVIYKSTDNIIDPLVNGLPTGDDVVLTNPDQGNAPVILNVLLSPGTTYKLNLSYAVIHVSMIPTYIYGRLFNSTSVATATKYMSFTAPYYVAAGLPVNVPIMPNYGWKTDPVWQWIFPPATYTLTVTSTPDGKPIYKDNVDTGQVTPHTFDPGEAGTYKVVDPLYTWEPAEIVVPALTENTTINFVGTLIPPDTYTYNLHIEGPAGYAVTGPNAELSGIIPYTKTSTVVTDLVGDYTVADPLPGYQWVMNPITVTADMFQLVTTKNGGMNKVVLGSRTNGAKTNYVYEATITFVMEPIPVQYYNVLITSEPAGAAILVDNVDTGFVTPYTFTMEEGASATYTVVMDHYTWNPTEFVVTNISENMSCNFVGTPYYDIPDGVPTTPTGATVTVTITITGGNANYGSGVLPPWVNPSFTPIEQYFLSLIGTGPWTITFNTTAPWAAYFLGGIWHAVQNTGLAITFTIDVSKDVPNVPVVLGNEDPTLPVELSYFAATLTAENFVNIAWTTQTETNMNGFNIYRNDGSDNLASAIQIAYIPATNTSTTQNYEHLDNKDLENGHTYYYWLECVEISGHSTFNGPRSAYVDGPTTPVLPEYTKMHNAYPNPFRAGSGTTIAVELKKGDSGTVTIYNILGQVVKTFSLTEGTNNLNWNGRDSKGNLCGNGIYFYKLSTNSLNQTKKMVIVK